MRTRVRRDAGPGPPGRSRIFGRCGHRARSGSISGGPHWIASSCSIISPSVDDFLNRVRLRGAGQAFQRPAHLVSAGLGRWERGPSCLLGCSHGLVHHRVGAKNLSHAQQAANHVGNGRSGLAHGLLPILGNGARLLGVGWSPCWVAACPRSSRRACLHLGARTGGGMDLRAGTGSARRTDFPTRPRGAGRGTDFPDRPRGARS